MGEELARRGIGLVYGGGNVGLMGVMANSALEGGGKVVGVIPEALSEKEVAHEGLMGLHVVGSMHERKKLMADLSEAFVALPGGYGTMEEITEVISWAQLSIHTKPCGLLNVEGYWDPLISLFDTAVAEGFLSPDHRKLVLEGDEPDRLLDTIEGYVPPPTGEWLGAGEL
jgi:uncharacterized protein (TIGR00730 family)